MGLDQSPLEYNGINLFIVKTNLLSQRPVHTHDHIDYLYTEFILDVNCIYNPEATSYNFTDPPTWTPGFPPSQTNASIRHALMQPRHYLNFFSLFGSIIESPDTITGIDANNGPMPMACDVFQLGMDKTFHVHYVIKTWLRECPNGNNDAIISNRWSQTQTIDSQRMMVRRTIGQAYFRTDILDISDTFADIYRRQVIAAIPPKPGLYRESVKFITTPQGNALHYEIIDVERMYNLNDTISNNTFVTKVDGYFSQGTMADGPKEGAAVGCSLIEMKVQVWGAFEANNWTLIQIAISIINQQVPLGDIGPAGLAILRQVNMLQSIVDHYVEVTIAVQVNLNKKIAPPATPFSTKYLEAVEPVNNYFDPGRGGINPGLQNDVGSRGSDQTYLRSSLLTEACLPQDSPIPNQDSPVPGQQTPYGDPPNIQIFESDILPPIELQYQPSTPPYNQYNTESQYDYHSGALQAPIANPNNPSSGGASTGTSINGPYQCEILNFCAPYASIIVDWWVERIGVPPDIPHFIKSIQCLAGDHQATLRNASNTIPSVSLSNDLTTWIFNVSGRYEYIVPFAPDPTNPPMLVFDTPPNTTAQYGDSFVQGDQSGNCASGQLSSQYVHGIIDSGSGGSSTGGSPGDS